MAHEGFRRESTHRDRSDLDVIFVIRGNPPKRDVYPLLIKRLVPTLNVQAKVVTSYDAIKIKKDQIRCDFVIRTESQFHKQIDDLNIKKFKMIQNMYPTLISRRV